MLRALVAVLAAGCGSLGAGPASDRVPNAGVEGWHALAQVQGTAIHEPYVFCPATGARDPAALRLADGSYRLWYLDPTTGRISAGKATGGIYDWTDEGGVATLGTAGGIGVAADASGFVLAAARADGSAVDLFHATAPSGPWTATSTFTAVGTWDAGRVSSPSLLVDPTSGDLELYFAAGAPPSAIGRATLSGAVWTEDAAPLFGTTDAGANGWPVLSVGGPWAGIDTSRPGGTVWKLWFTGEAPHGSFPFGIDGEVGFAGSFDGTTWAQYAGDPVYQDFTISLPPGPTPVYGDVREPSVIALPDDTYRMYYEDDYDDGVSPPRPCVALAETP